MQGQRLWYYKCHSHESKREVGWRGDKNVNSIISNGKIEDIEEDVSLITVAIPTRKYKEVSHNDKRKLAATRLKQWKTMCYILANLTPSSSGCASLNPGIGFRGMTRK